MYFEKNIFAGYAADRACSGKIALFYAMCTNLLRTFSEVRTEKQWRKSE